MNWNIATKNISLTFVVWLYLKHNTCKVCNPFDAGCFSCNNFKRYYLSIILFGLVGWVWLCELWKGFENHPIILITCKYHWHKPFINRTFQVSHLQVLCAYIHQMGNDIWIDVPLVGMKIALALTNLSVPFVIRQTGVVLWNLGKLF